jgi:hypothetical protein
MPPASEVILLVDDIRDHAVNYEAETGAPASADEALLGFKMCPGCESDTVRATLRVGAIQYYCCKTCGFCWRAETLTKVSAGLVRPAGDLRSQLATAHHHPVERQQDHRSEEGHQVTSGLTGTVESHRAADESAEHRSRDTDQHCHDDAAGIAPWHHELGESAHNQTKQNPSDDGHHELSSCETYGLTAGRGSQMGIGGGSSYGVSGISSSRSRSRGFGSGGVRLGSDGVCMMKTSCDFAAGWV